MSKSWFNLTFSTIPTSEALLVDPKPTVQIWRNILDLQKYTIFGENSCPALPVSPEILWFAEIRPATSTKSSIEMCRKGQDQWCFHLLPFLALKTIRKSGFFRVVYILKLLPLFTTSLVAQWSKHHTVEALIVPSSNLALAKNVFLQKIIQIRT